jgi:hypothetical protein
MVADETVSFPPDRPLTFSLTCEDYSSLGFGPVVVQFDCHLEQVLLRREGSARAADVPA